MTNSIPLLHIKKSAIYGCSICLWLSSAANAASAVPDYDRHEGIVDFRPYVSANASYDSNVFRLANSSVAQQLLGTSQLSDNLLKTEAGLETHVRLSRQLIILDLSVNDTKYNKFTNLDYTGNSKNLEWDWQLGNHLDGIIAYSDVEEASGFVDVINSSATVRTNNVRTTTTEKAGINYHFHPNWTAFSLFQHSEYSNSNAAFVFGDRQQDALEGGVQYISDEQTQLALSLKNTDYNYSNRTAGSLALFGNTSTRQEIIGVVSWQATYKTNLSAHIAAVSLDYPDHSNRNFSDISQRWILSYALSPDTSISTNAYKEVNQIDDPVSTYAQSEGISISPSWTISPKSSVGASAEYKNVEFLGSSGLTQTGVTRKDEIQTYGVFGKYQATQKVFIQLIYAGTKRKSNLTNLNFNDNTISASIAYEF